MTDLTSMTYWWPLVRDLPVPQPETRMVMVDPPTDAEMLLYREDDDSEKPPPLMEYAELLMAAAHELGYPERPVFLRTDLRSGKHSYLDTCHVPALPGATEIEAVGALMQHAFAVTEHHALEEMFGPGGEVRALVVREHLDLMAGFSAFHGLPIAPERRYFVLDGRALCHHSYWPEDAIADGYPDAADWPALLAEVNSELPDEIALLTKHAELVSAAVKGAWSVDFAYGAEYDWYLIDMAEAASSWHPEDCPMLSASPHP